MSVPDRPSLPSTTPVLPKIDWTNTVLLYLLACRSEIDVFLSAFSPSSQRKPCFPIFFRAGNGLLAGQRQVADIPLQTAISQHTEGCNKCPSHLEIIHNATAS